MANVTKNMLSVELEDDSTPYGGTAFAGETLKDFLESADMADERDLDTVNAALVECGILPIAATA